jgi:flagellar biosynthesis GTPase FlhF
MMHQELEWSARIIENLSKKVEDLQLEIDSMYYNDLFTRGMNFASSVLSDTMTYLEKIGAETNATIMNEKREKKKRMEEKRRLEKIWKEAEELRNKMEPEQMEKEEQMERERQERERQEEERRRQEEEERRRQEEEERKRQEEDRRRQRDNRKRQREHSQQNTGRTSNDDGCVSRGKVPKIANTKSEYRKLLLLFHPDKNLGCTSEANRKFRLLRELNRSNPVLETSK